LRSSFFLFFPAFITAGRIMHRTKSGRRKWAASVTDATEKGAISVKYLHENKHRVEQRKCLEIRRRSAGQNKWKDNRVGPFLMPLPLVN